MPILFQVPACVPLCTSIFYYLWAKREKKKKKRRVTNREMEHRDYLCQFGARWWLIPPIVRFWLSHSFFWDRSPALVFFISATHTASLTSPTWFGLHVYDTPEALSGKLIPALYIHTYLPIHTLLGSCQSKLLNFEQRTAALPPDEETLASICHLTSHHHT